MTGRSHLSIGEVLSLLQEEFPDVTISKIRFLESQGLVDPERTPSGYRKFYEPDIERLRWVLRQQRDAFLPLKVIKGRLEEHDDDQGDEPGLEGAGREGPGPERAGPEGAGPEGSGLPRAAAAPASVAEARPGERAPDPVPGAVAVSARAGGQRARTGQLGGQPEGLVAQARGTDAGGAEPPAAALTAGQRRRAERGNGNGRMQVPMAGGAEPAARLFDAGPAPDRGSNLPPAVPATRAPAARPAPAGATGRGAPVPGSRAQRHPSRAGLRPGRQGPSAPPPLADEELSLDELMARAEVDAEAVRDLERYGLVTPKVVAGVAYYTADAAVIARLAGSFARHGVEARHLRAYKGAAEREAGLVQQVIMPLIRQRNPEAREAAARAVEELSHLGGELRTVLLRDALSDLH